LHDFVMDNVAYTSGDQSSKSHKSMKAHALAFALDCKHFLTSCAGAQYLSDGDEGLMSYLFPHLDPWGIGGFNHPARSRGQTLSFEQQVKNLLLQDDSAFERDPYFVFICWNIIQKRQVSINSTFGVRASTQCALTSELYNVSSVLTDLANKWSVNPWAKPSTRQEKCMVKVLRQLNVAAKSLHGSSGYKLCRRNEIRSLMRKFKTPALFITINAHDLTSMGLATVAGIEEDHWHI
ncbi:hypothetical protein BDN67DRAFT_876520, partial [Paxillus ammoniavirescens]